MHYILIAVILIALALVLFAGESDAPDPEVLERTDSEALKDVMEDRVDELSDEEVLELWKALRKDMKRRERRGVIFSERLKLEAEERKETLEEFDRELQEELVTLEESND